MTQETIVAIFETIEEATAAVRDLQSAGVPASDISQHSKAATTAAAPHHEEGFWARMFGGEPAADHDTSVYNRSLDSGSTVVTVKASEAAADKILDILEKHDPIDIDERAESYGSMSTTATATAKAKDTDVETLQLSEETLAVGKRAVNKGTTRIRRYVVETPVEESIGLREEKVSIERRPVSGTRSVTGADFTDKVIEMTETDEEAVVSKTARVREEVVVRKDVTDRTETIHDTVRREDVEIEKDGVVDRGAGTMRP